MSRCDLRGRDFYAGYTGGQSSSPKNPLKAAIPQRLTPRNTPSERAYRTPCRPLCLSAASSSRTLLRRWKLQVQGESRSRPPGERARRRQCLNDCRRNMSDDWARGQIQCCGVALLPQTIKKKPWSSQVYHPSRMATPLILNRSTLSRPPPSPPNRGPPAPPPSLAPALIIPASTLP
jgi:hypothetical protein